MTKWVRLLAVLVVLGWHVSHAFAEVPIQEESNGGAESQDEFEHIDFAELEERLGEIEEKVHKASVRVFERGGNRSGSAFLVGTDGYILTAAHVAQFAAGKLEAGKTTISIELSSRLRKEAVLIGYDFNVDLALLKIDGSSSLEGLEFAPRGSLDYGERVLCFGVALNSPDEMRFRMRTGTVLGLALSNKLMRTDCTIQSGDSGGPVLDLDGRVLGVNVLVRIPITENFHVSLEMIHTHWGPMKKGGEVGTEVLEKELAESKLKQPKDDEAALLEQSRMSNIRSMEAIFQDADDSVVRVLGVSRFERGMEDYALGTVVTSDGLVVTKASQIGVDGDLFCQWSGENPRSAKRVYVDHAYDLAVLKVEGVEIETAPWVIESAAACDLLISPRSVLDAPVLGVCDRTRRKVVSEMRSEFAATVEDTDKGVQVIYVPLGVLKKRDIIHKVGHCEVKSTKELEALLGGYRPGTTVRFEVIRGDETRSVYVPLMGDLRFGEGQVCNDRSSYFPDSFSHDATIKRGHVGGPVFNLDGEIVGVNIARNDRSRVYALTSSAVMKVVNDYRESIQENNLRGPK